MQPLLLLAVYTFTFSIIFKSRWDRQGGGQIEFALFLVSGLMIFELFAECVNEAPNLLMIHQGLIKQLVFPSEVLAWVSVIAALFNFLATFVIMAVLYVSVIGLPAPTVLLLPVVILPIVLLTLGSTWILASLGVFLRDISQVVGLLVTAVLFLSPIFYTPSHIPEPIRAYYYLNPFASIIEMARGVLFHAQTPHWRVLGLVLAATWPLAWIGYAWFMKTKSSFADVL